MTTWQPIEIVPDRPMPVLFFFAHGKFRTIDDEWHHAAECMPPCREERIIVGFWDGEEWCENGTGHSVMEEWRAPDWFPTHWMPLPETPQ